MGKNLCFASSIEVAETAKVIENTQRDVNIGLMNEIAKICGEIGIDTNEVIDVASTKWNFMPFRPGLVGGHCIGVDPYYLTHKATELNLQSDVILAGRRVNEQMGSYCAEKFIKCLLNNGKNLSENKVLILGVSFKENCTDTRNSKVFTMAESLSEYNCKVDVYDPVITGTLKGSSTINFIKKPKSNYYDGIILAVPHDIFIVSGATHIRSYGKFGSIFFDLKGAFPVDQSDMRL